LTDQSYVGSFSSILNFADELKTMIFRPGTKDDYGEAIRVTCPFDISSTPGHQERYDSTLNSIALSDDLIIC
jgi:hypothetical protein